MFRSILCIIHTKLDKKLTLEITDKTVQTATPRYTTRLSASPLTSQGAFVFNIRARPEESELEFVFGN